MLFLRESVKKEVPSAEEADNRIDDSCKDKNEGTGVDAGGCHCCQCSTPKWLTLIFRAEFSFLKML